MEMAIDEARASLRHFLEAYKAPKANQRGFYVKVRFQAGGTSEQVWLNDVVMSEERGTGFLAHEAQLPGLHLGSRVEFHKDWITDWTYEQDGRRVGSFTAKGMSGIRTAVGYRASVAGPVARRCFTGETIH
jgi:uncharacterized protein YegJ (DUF2314 family)